MLTDRSKTDIKANRSTPGQFNPFARLGPLLAIILLSLLAAAVFCFSVLAATPDCWRQAAAPRALEFNGNNRSGPLQRFLDQQDVEGAGKLALYPPDSEIALASITSWPQADGMGLAAPFFVRTEPLDSDYDGFTDQLISTDFRGRVWLTNVTAAGFGTPLLLADLTHSDWRFIAGAGVADVSLPLPLRPEGLTGRHRLLLLIARHVVSGEDALVALRVPGFAIEAEPVNFAALFDRTVLTAEERESGMSHEQWLAIVDNAGWWVRLAGQITQPPKVVAGVIYSVVATSDFNAVECADQTAEHSLVAMHLHSAGLVYNQRRFRLQNGEGRLTLQQQADGTAALVLDNTDEQQLVLSELKMISPECADCAEPLQLDQFPRWLNLATYRQETGAH
jgi:hypothetical protein